MVKGFDTRLAYYEYGIKGIQSREGNMRASIGYVFMAIMRGSGKMISHRKRCKK